MRYTVVWTPRALDRLAKIWTQARDRQAVTDASDRLDVALRDDPDTKGKVFWESTSVVSRRRLGFCPSLIPVIA
jgi:hypothetical protein